MICYNHNKYVRFNNVHKNKKRKAKIMKKILAIFVAMLLLTVTCMSVVAADPETYIWAKCDDRANFSAAPSFQLVLGEEELSVLEDGKQYQVFANVWFSSECVGNVYFNFFTNFCAN